MVKRFENWPGKRRHKLISAQGGAVKLIHREAQDYTILLLGDVPTLSIVGWPTPGEPTKMQLTFKQDGTGGHSVTWPSAWYWPGGTAPTVTSDPNAIDVVELITNDGGVEVYAAIAQNFAQAA